MDLLDIYASMQRGGIDADGAAKLFGLHERAMSIRISRWGHRLPLMLSLMDKLKRAEVTTAEAADVLSVSTREINRLMKSWNVRRPIKSYRLTKAASAVKWELRKKYAIDYIAGSINIEEAAMSADVTSRQMRRWVTDLLKTHRAIAWKDLKRLSNRQRWRLAGDIETAESLEMSKQQVLQSITYGQTTINEVALERVVLDDQRRQLRACPDFCVRGIA
jgi:hypothetical protein